MSKTSSDKPRIEKHKVKNHTVEIRHHGATEELWIDGERRRFARTKRGYSLYENAYAPPARSLLEAVDMLLAKRGSKEKHPHRE